MIQTNLLKSKRICNICGGNDFTDKNRSSRYGLPPNCVTCGSGERDRVIRKIYGNIPEKYTKNRRLLQFSNDNSINRNAFASFEISLYQGENSLDLMNIDRPDESYDWVVSNQVLEHVSDDLQAVKELLRILTPLGIIHINIPNPAYNIATRDWGYPDPKIYDHYRHYGSDFPSRIDQVLTDANAYAIQIIDTDDVTDTIELIYLIGKSFSLIQQIATYLSKAKCIVLRAK